MGKRTSTSTGANTEPMPFIRRFGSGADAEQTDEPPFETMRQDDDDFDDKKRMSRHSERSHKKSRKRSRERRKKKRSRSRSSSRSSRRRSSSRSPRRRSYSRSPRRRSSSRSRSPHRRDDERGSERVYRPPIPTNVSLPTPLFEVAAKLPPQVRGQVVAQSLLVKPEALPTVLSEAAKNAGGLLEPSARERKKKSRWSSTKAFVPGMPTILPADMDDTQRQGYLLQLEIEEATRKLRMGDYMPPEGAERSPSPEPVYDSNGKRLNTREVRKKQELEQLRHEKIQALLKINPSYKPPTDYRAPNIRLHEKVWIPQEAHPEINFVGLLIGPRGNTLKALEQETQAKIIIRGKGSVKEGKLSRREGPLPGENEPLHAYITGPEKAIIKRACERINEIINAALLIPEGHNEMRKLQLRELAVLNGTLRPEDILNSARCSNCGSDQHKTWECPDALNVTANVICTNCGGAGHIARDCKVKNEGGVMPSFDAEYSAFMEMLGERPSQAPHTTQGVAQFGTFRKGDGSESSKSKNGGETSDFKPTFFGTQPRKPYKPLDSGTLPPPPDFLKAWQDTAAAGYDYSAYYAQYAEMDQFYGLHAPPPPPSLGNPMPVPPVSGDFGFSLDPPPPPPSM